MGYSNYPAGVTDAHPYFNPEEVNVMVECGAEEALVLPSFAVKQKLNDLQEFVTRLAKQQDAGFTKDILDTLAGRIENVREELEPLERESDYECPYRDERLLPVSEEAEWDCPDCGNTHSTDTLPEGPDPDEGWDNRYDD